MAMFEKEYDVLYKTGIVPVVALDSPDDAVPLATALLKGGITSMEITFRNPSDYEGTARAIRDVHEKVPAMHVGAGTVTSVDLTKAAIDSGARFIVSPGFKEDVVDYSIAHGIVTYPGVSTASEITAAAAKGLSVLKFFPAEISGGVATLKAFAGPFPRIKFLPSGGLNLDNMGNYFALPNVAAVSGSWMVKGSLIKANQWDEITRLSKEAIEASLGFAFAHVGINFHGDGECAEGVKEFEAFGFKGVEGELSWFCGTEFELMKNGVKGKNGHIGVLTYNIERALAYLADRGFKPVADSAQWTGDAEKSPLKFIYLDKEINGFAVHLKKR